MIQNDALVPPRHPAAVLPASGGAERMDGRHKLLLPIADTTVLGLTCRALLAGGVEEMVVVVRDDDETLQTWCGDHGFEVALNTRPERGMLASIQRGIHHLGGPQALAARRTDLLVTPADLPALQPLSVRAVLLAADHHPEALVVPEHEGTRGHPLRIPPQMIGGVFNLDLEVGLRQLLEQHPDRVHEVPVDDPGVALDVDTEADYQRLRTLIETRSAS